MDILELPRRWPLYSEGLLLDVVDSDQRFRLPNPSLMGLVGANMAGRSGPFSDTIPSPAGVPALEGFPNLFREAGREVREAGRWGRGPDGGSVPGPEGRLGWNDRGSSSRAERCSIFEVGGADEIQGIIVGL